jgi:restriction system protein
MVGIVAASASPRVGVLPPIAIERSASLIWPLAGVAALLIAVEVVLALRRRWRTERSGIAGVERMDGPTFAACLTDLFGGLGYEVLSQRHHADVGAELIIARDGRRTAVHAKRATGRIGASAVSDALAAMDEARCGAALVVANGHFTREARRLARTQDVALWDRDTLTRRLLAAQTGPRTSRRHRPAGGMPTACALCGVNVSETARAWCAAHAARCDGHLFCDAHLPPPDGPRRIAHAAPAPVDSASSGGQN